VSGESFKIMALYICGIYFVSKKLNNEDMEKLQEDMDRLGEWAVENKSK